MSIWTSLSSRFWDPFYYVSSPPWLTSIFLPVLMGSLPMLFLLQRDQKKIAGTIWPPCFPSPRELVKEKYFLAGICALCYPWIMAFGQTIASYDEIPTPSLDMSLFATGALFLFFRLFFSPWRFFKRQNAFGSLT